MEWLHARGVPPIDWPPHSPDLNPIEQIWAWIKNYLAQKVYRPLPAQKNKLDTQRFKDKIQEAWAAVPEGVIRRLLLSMGDRLRAVIKARGWYTKYQ
jgi:hypothetical protein